MTISIVNQMQVKQGLYCKLGQTKDSHLRIYCVQNDTKNGVYQSKVAMLLKRTIKYTHNIKSTT